jgi:hypothetical protein
MWRPQTSVSGSRSTRVLSTGSTLGFAGASITADGEVIARATAIFRVLTDRPLLSTDGDDGSPAPVSAREA